ncbi:MAG: signal peptidase I [Acidimicrobiales bacterium]
MLRPSAGDVPDRTGSDSGADPSAPDGAGLSDEDYLDEYFEPDVFSSDDERFYDTTSAVTRNALEWAVVLVGAVLVALLIRLLVFQAFYIPSESMESTLMTNDRVLVNKISYRLHDVNRGDVVVFVRPENDPGEIRDLIKRVIGLPGETIEGRDNAIYIDGLRLDEPYLDPGVTIDDFGPLRVPEGQVFVMGDNRAQSADSRVFGPIDTDRIVGRAFVLIWPLGRFGSL